MNITQQLIDEPEMVKTYYTIKKNTKEAIETLAKDKKSYGAVIDKAVELLMNKD